MKFGIVLEVSVPRPFTPAGEYAVWQNCLEQVRVADALGFDQVWAVEHHFLEEQSHCSAPEMLLAACAVQTTNIHLCHGIVVCVPGFTHPVRVAERAAVLDVLSGGRMELGTGRSATWTELAGFGVDPDSTKKSWDEYVRAIPKMWTQDTYSRSGLTFSMPERPILPKPIQQPHPPLWVAVTSPGTEIDAADRGLGSLGLTLGGFDKQEKTIATYRKRIQNCDPVGDFVNEQVNCVNFLYCHEDADYAAQQGRKLAGTFNYHASQQVFIKDNYPTQAYASDGLFASLRQQSGKSSAGGLPPGLATGDPSQVIEAIKRWESIGVDRLIFLLNCVEVIPQEEVLNSLRLFASEVMPHFQDSNSVPSTNAKLGVR